MADARPAPSTLYALTNPYAVDMAIMHEKERIVVVRFGLPDTLPCMEADELLASTEVKLSRMAVFYTVDRDVVRGFDSLYELEGDDFALLFYHGGKRIECDFGRAGRYKLTSIPETEVDFIDMISDMYYNAQQGRLKYTKNS